MNARGSTEVIVATIGLSMGALSQNLFTMIVAMAVITTMAMPPMLRWALRARCRCARRSGSGSSARSSRPRASYRIWSACCWPSTGAPNGSFASRLAGVLAGTRGLPITVLPLAPDGEPPREAARRTTRASSGRRGGASDRRRRANRERTSQPPTAGRRHLDPQSARAPTRRSHEARKGYDLLSSASSNTRRRERRVSPRRHPHRRGFDGPLAIVAGKGVHLERAAAEPAQDPGAGHRHGGVAPRRRGRDRASLGACDAPVTALYVAAGSRRARRSRSGLRATPAGAGDPQGHRRAGGPLRRRDQTAMRADRRRDEAILRASKPAGTT